MRNRLTVKAVELAINECRDVGHVAFRRAYGFHRSRRYCLMYEGEAFDTKPIAAVAFKHLPGFGRPLTRKEISGGIATPDCAASILSALGFEVREMFPDAWDRGDPFEPTNDDDAEDDWLDHDGVHEGTPVLKAHLRRERRSAGIARMLKRATLKRTGRLACEVCDFDFASTYGGPGSGYIEAHHIVPLSEADEGVITRITDLALVCANCHRMLHRSGDLTVDELRATRRAANGNTRSAP
ncbi:HNH endonuclease [Roseibacterium beibuensis]|uniref:HNH endonuclease n=1 Tax=[Roseibacterium] beibuensis TaxID=1193142 RepID=UPI00217F1A3E|nr:HNH endonuclease [Roseibacterium beibuensis]MCS6627910.1 HNH endonuclease [Roseibacterium beibuensis]